MNSSTRRVLVGLSLVMFHQASAQLGSGGLQPGDILVSDYTSAPNGNGRLFWVNRATGQRIVVTDFNSSAQGFLTPGAYGVAVPDLNTILLVDSFGTSNKGALIQVDPVTGARTILSDFGNELLGPVGVLPITVAVIGGQTLVIDRDGGTAEHGALLRVNRTTGVRTLVSDFGNPAQGAIGENPHQISRGRGGVILVIDADAGTDERGALFSIDAVTGFRTLVSDFGDPNQGPLGVNPGGVTQGADGVLLVTDTTVGPGEPGALFKVDPSTGQRTILSDFGDLAQGEGGVDPFPLEVGPTGEILVVDAHGGTDIPNDGVPNGNGALFAVNRLTGHRTLVSDFGNVTQGQTGVNPSGIAVVPLVQPDDVLLGAQSPAAGVAGAALVAVNPTTGQRRFVSRFADSAQGPTAANVYDVTIGSDGDILAIDSLGGGVFVIDRVNGIRTLVSSLSNAAQGPTGTQPRSVMLGVDGRILVGITNPAGILSVDPTTGSRTLMHPLNNAAFGVLGTRPEDLEATNATELLVLDGDGLSPIGVPGRGLLFRVDLATNQRTIITDFGDSTQGPLGTEPHAMVREASGHFLVSEFGSSPSMIFRLNLATGERTIVSSSANADQGPGRLFKEVMRSEEDRVFVLDASFDQFGRGALLEVDPNTGTRTVVSSFRDTTKGAEINTVAGLAIFPKPPVPIGGPVAMNGSLTTSEDAAAPGTLTASDPNAAPLAYSIVTNGTLGTAVITNPATGAYTYTPAADAFGNDTFTFLAGNGTEDSNIATIDVEISPVNDAPVASSALLALPTGTSKDGVLVGSDIDSSDLAFSIVTPPSKGTVSITNITTGAYTYIADPGPSGIDSFTFKVNDGALDSNVASIGINLSGNDPPVAVDATYSTTEDKPVSSALKATDPEGAKLTYALVTNGARGTATITNPSNGRFTYRPNPDEFGNDEFTFHASDGATLSNVATVKISIIPVNDPPVASDSSVSTPSGATYTGQLSATDPEGDSLTFTLAKGRRPRNGTVVIQPSGEFTFTPASDFVGTESFKFQVSDGTATASASVTVTVLAP